MHYAPTGVPQYRSLYQTRGAIVRGFKSVVTKEINVLCGTPEQPFWQRNYFEQVLRNNKEFLNIRQYMINNPLKWVYDLLEKLDNEYPVNRRTNESGHGHPYGGASTVAQQLEIKINPFALREFQ